MNNNKTSRRITLNIYYRRQFQDNYKRDAIKIKKNIITNSTSSIELNAELKKL